MQIETIFLVTQLPKGLGSFFMYLGHTKSSKSFESKKETNELFRIIFILNVQNSPLVFFYAKLPSLQLLIEGFKKLLLCTFFL